jgi:tetratricopeptide (TPR) repeat protein
LNGLGGAALHVEDFAEAEGYYQRSLAIHRELEDEEWASRGLNNLGVSARGQGDTRRALGLFEEALQIRLRLGAVFGIATLQHNIGDALTALGDPEAANPHMRACVRLNLGYNDLHGLAQGLAGTARIWLAQNRRHADAARLLGFSAPHLGYPGPTAGGSDHVEFEEQLALARARLGEPGLAEAMAAGGRMPAAEAAALALRE